MYGGIDTPELRALVGARVLPFNVIVIGPQGAGKSTFAELLGKALGCRVCETSEVVMQAYARIWSQGIEIHTYEEELVFAREKRASARRFLVSLGDIMTSIKPECLMESCTAGAPGGCIIVGARRKIEVEAWFKDSRHWKDVLIEITGGDGQDDVFELAGWHPAAHPQLQSWKADKHIIPQLPLAMWQARATEIAAEILDNATFACTVESTPAPEGGWLDH